MANDQNDKQTIDVRPETSRGATLQPYWWAGRALAATVPSAADSGP